MHFTTATCSRGFAFRHLGSSLTGQTKACRLSIPMPLDGAKFYNYMK